MRHSWTSELVWIVSLSGVAVLGSRSLQTAVKLTAGIFFVAMALLVTDNMSTPRTMNPKSIF